MTRTLICCHPWKFLRLEIEMQRFYPWVLVALLWVVCFLNYADRQAIFSIFPLLKSEMGLSPVQLGFVASAFMWMYAVAGPLAGWIADKVSPKRVVLMALAFWSAVTAATAFCHSYTPLLVVRSLGGLGEAFYFPAAMALIGAVHTAATRSRAMAVHQSSVYAGTIGGGAISAVIAEQYGWRIGFLLFGVAGVTFAIVLAFLLRPAPIFGQRERGNPLTDFADGVRAVLGSPRVVVMIATFMGANFVAVVFLTWLPTFLLEKFHMSLGSAGINSTVYLQIASVIGVLLGGVLADRFAIRRLGGRQAVQALGLLGGVPFLFLIGSSLELTGLIGGMIGFGFFKGIYDANIWASLYDVIPVEKRGIAAGVMNSLGWVGGGFAPIVIGASTERFGLGTCLSATSLIYLGLSAMLFLLARSMSRASIQQAISS
jgi:MFS family permease